MTVSMQQTKRIYAGNGLTRNWEVDFPFSSADDICVFLTSPEGEETQITTNFELDTEGNLLIYPTLESEQELLPSGWKISLVRKTPLTQEIDLLRQGEFDAEVLEQGYDKLTMIVQELSEKIDRSIKYPVSTQPADLDTDTFLNTILAAKQAALDASTQAANAAQTAGNSATSAAQTATSAIGAIETASQTAQNTLSTQAESYALSLAQSVSDAEQAAQNAQYYAQHSLGKQIGEVYFSESSSAQDNPGGLPLFTGETIANADQLYPDFYAWVADHSSLQISAADYATALTTYGECPKYVIDTVNKTIRLPKLVNYLKMANTTDGIAQASAGLPNITGSIQLQFTQGGSTNGAISCTTATSQGWGNSSGQNTTVLSFDASNSNSIYGNSATVTPPHTTLFPWVCAYNAAVPASTAQAAQFQAALSGKADTNLSNVSSSNVLDGQWENSYTQLAGSVTLANNTNYDYSLSTYLPDDVYKYEVMGSITAETPSSSGNSVEIAVWSDVITKQSMRVCATKSQSSSTQKTAGFFILPVGSSRQISLSNFGTNNSTLTYFRLYGYRRIGTNS